MQRRILTKNQVADIERTYMVANTPTYLYKTLRENVAVQKLAESNTLLELASLYKRRAGKKRRSLGDVAVAYAAFVAMSLKERSGAQATMSAIDTSLLDWATPIKNRFCAEEPNVATILLNATPGTSVSVSQTIPVASTFSRLNGSAR